MKEDEEWVVMAPFLLLHFAIWQFTIYDYPHLLGLKHGFYPHK